MIWKGFTYMHLRIPTFVIVILNCPQKVRDQKNLISFIFFVVNAEVEGRLFQSIRVLKKCA